MLRLRANIGKTGHNVRALPAACSLTANPAGRSANVLACLEDRGATRNLDYKHERAGTPKSASPLRKSEYYLISTFAPASSSCFLSASASAFERLP